MSIRDNFARAAATYDQFADVQAEVATRLACLLPQPAADMRVVELGCGTGKFTAQLRRQLPTARIFVVDFAYQMLVRASGRLLDEQVFFLCQDIASFLACPVPVRADMFVSNATLQWLPDLGKIVADLHRHLRPGGELLFSIFGPQTLLELQQALDAVLPGKAQLAAHVFADRTEIRRMLGKYFVVELEEEAVFRRRHDKVLDLLRQINKTGTGGAHSRPLRLNRNSLARLDQWFGLHYGGCLTSYQVFFFRCRP